MVVWDELSGMNVISTRSGLPVVAGDRRRRHYLGIFRRGLDLRAVFL